MRARRWNANKRDRGRRTRDALIHAARSELEAVGYSDARVADMTQRAAVSYGSFYRYFEDKDAVFREVARSVAAEMFEASAVTDLADLDAIQKIEEANRRYLRAYAYHARIMSVIEETAPYNLHARDLLREIRALFALGRSSPPPEYGPRRFHN